MKTVEHFVDVESEVSKMEYELISEYVRLRKAANLSQQAIADQSNIIRTTIARVENQMNSPQVKTLLQMLSPLGYTLKIVKKENKK